MDDKILQRIDGIIKHINTVQRRMNGVSLNDFLSNTLLIDASSFSIAQIGERMVKLEQLLKNKYPEVPWTEARRMRNIIVHDYDETDPKKIYSTIVVDLEPLKQHFLKIKDDIKHISDNSLTTQRLIIRPWDDLDADELFELAKDPEIGYLCGWSTHKNLGDSLFVLHNFLEVEETYAICLKDNNRIIGSIGLRFGSETNLTNKDDECELGFWIGKPYWGNGYAEEAANEVIKHAFVDLYVSIIWCGYFDGNNKSKRVQEKLHFMFHHTCEIANIEESKEIRTSHITCLKKEDWISKNT